GFLAEDVGEWGVADDVVAGADAAVVEECHGVGDGAALECGGGGVDVAVVVFEGFVGGLGDEGWGGGVFAVRGGGVGVRGCVRGGLWRGWCWGVVWGVGGVGLGVGGVLGGGGGFLGGGVVWGVGGGGGRGGGGVRSGGSRCWG